MSNMAAESRDRYAQIFSGILRREFFLGQMTKYLIMRKIFILSTWCRKQGEKLRTLISS